MQASPEERSWYKKPSQDHISCIPTGLSSTLLGHHLTMKDMARRRERGWPTQGAGFWYNSPWGSHGGSEWNSRAGGYPKPARHRWAHFSPCAHRNIHMRRIYAGRCIPPPAGYGRRCHHKKSWTPHLYRGGGPSWGWRWHPKFHQHPDMGLSRVQGQRIGLTASACPQSLRGLPSLWVLSWGRGGLPETGRRSHPAQWRAPGRLYPKAAWCPIPLQSCEPFQADHWWAQRSWC